jgi:SHS2 domain-containing protein
MFETFEHTADLGLRVAAPDLSTLFREAAEGLVSMVVEDPPAQGFTRDLELSLASERLDWLFFDWLSELLYRIDSERLLLGAFRVEASETEVRAAFEAMPLDPERHRLLREVKAITYHGLRVERTASGWLAEVIVDI